MRLNTSGFYDAGAKRMAALSTRADALQVRIAEGKKVRTPSDDALAFTRLQTLARAGADDETDAGNLKVAAGALAQADTALDAMGELMRQASELTVRAANGTLGATDRKAIGAELASLLDGLVALVNRTDARGQPMFGGPDGEPAATRLPDGSWSLATTTGSPIPIGEGQSVQTGEAASRVLAVGDTDALTLLGGLVTALAAGDPLPPGAVDDVAASSEQIGVVQASLGARAARVEVAQAMLFDVAADREEAQGVLEGSRPEDMTAAITELQKTMTILQATQASFSKLQSLSLFDYLR